MCSTERNRDFGESGFPRWQAPVPTKSVRPTGTIFKTYSHYIKEAVDRLDRTQEQAWIAQGLDKDGNPKTGTVLSNALRCCRRSPMVAKEMLMAFLLNHESPQPLMT